MEQQPAVRKSTLYITVWMLALSALLQSVFLIIGQWDWTVLTGNLLSGSVSLFHYWLLFHTVAKAAMLEDADQQKQRIRLSHMLRYLLLAAVLAVGLLLPKVFSVWTVVIPVFFPRIAMLFLPLFKKQLD